LVLQIPIGTSNTNWYFKYQLHWYFEYQLAPSKQMFVAICYFLSWVANSSSLKILLWGISPKGSTRNNGVESNFGSFLLPMIMLRDELIQTFGYPRACRFRKTKQTNQFWSLRLPTFFKTWFLLHKMWLKLAKIDQKLTKNGFFDKVSFFTVFVLRMSQMCSTTWKTWK
jgi:hypothetical protein